MASPLHTDRYRTPVTEAALWAVWVAARWVRGATALTRRFARRTGQAAHRLAVRAELAAADLLTGPAVDALDTAHTRLARRAPWLATGIVAAADLLYIAVR